MKSILMFTSALLLAGCANAPQAGDLVGVSIVDRRTGQILQTYRHQGKLYVAGIPGNKYGVILKNRDQGRILTVLSVDGVNAISGETAAVQQSGYVLDPYAEAEITGWRKSLSDVATFVFTALPDSYAARTGRAQNVGAIGVAVFRERVEPREEAITPQRSRRNAAESSMPADQSSALGAAKAPRAEERLGTGHGQRETSYVRYTDFRRATEQPAEVIRIYYDSYSNLVARGVISVRPIRDPNPFPGRFVPDPVG